MANVNKITDDNVHLIDKYKKPQAADDARMALLNSYHGALATLTRPGHMLEGYPMGSVVPFVLDKNGSVIVLISDIAEHTKNARASSRASLLIYDETKAEVQETWRLTIVGDLTQIEDAEDIKAVSDKYYRFYPNSKNYHKTHDFNFFRLKTSKFRFIKGFGKITWIDAGMPFTPSPFSFDMEQAIFNHMNEDHQSAMHHYLRLYDVTTDENIKVYMTGINQYGCHLRYQNKIYFIAFDNEISTTIQAREMLVKLARKPLQ